MQNKEPCHESDCSSYRTFTLVRRDLAAHGEATVARLLENAPHAMAETKALTLDYAAGGFAPETFDALVVSHAKKRMTPEAAEGLASFVEKRAGQWKAIGES